MNRLLNGLILWNVAAEECRKANHVVEVTVQPPIWFTTPEKLFNRLDKEWVKRLWNKRRGDALRMAQKELTCSRRFETQFRNALSANQNGSRKRYDPFELIRTAHDAMAVSRKLGESKLSARYAAAAAVIFSVAAELYFEIQRRRSDLADSTPGRPMFRCRICWRLPWGFSLYCPEHMVKHHITAKAGGTSNDVERRKFERAQRKIFEQDNLWLKVPVHSEFTQTTTASVLAPIAAALSSAPAASTAPDFLLMAICPYIRVPPGTAEWFSTIWDYCLQTKPIVRSDLQRLLKNKRWQEALTAFRRLDPLDSNGDIVSWGIKILMAELFLSYKHELPKRGRPLSAKGKADEAIKLLKSGVKKAEIARRMRVRPSAVSNWITRYSKSETK